MSKNKKILANIKRKAEAKAAAYEDGLATMVESARELEEAYRKRPLQIKAPLLGVIIGVKWQLMFQVSMFWSPVAWSRGIGKNRKKNKAGMIVMMGNIAMRNPAGEKTPDEDHFSLRDLANAQVEVGYIWIIDWIRGLQSIYNMIVGIFGFKGVGMLDLWGYVYFRQMGGPDSIYLPFVKNPRKVASLIKKLSTVMVAGEKAMGELVNRADEDARRRSC